MGWTPHKELMNNLKDCKEGLTVWGVNFDIQQLLYCLRNQCKDYFPINEVPEHVIFNLKLLESNLKTSEEVLIRTLDIIIDTIKELDGLNE